MRVFYLWDPSLHFRLLASVWQGKAEQCHCPLKAVSSEINIHGETTLHHRAFELSHGLVQGLVSKAFSFCTETFEPSTGEPVRNVLDCATLKIMDKTGEDAKNIRDGMRSHK